MSDTIPEQVLKVLSTVEIDDYNVRITARHRSRDRSIWSAGTRWHLSHNHEALEEKLAVVKLEE